MKEPLTEYGHGQGYLAHKKQPPPRGLPKGPRPSLTVWSWGGAGSYGRGTPVAFRRFRALGSGLGVRVGQLGRGEEDLGFMVYGLWFMVYGLWFMVYG